MNKLVSKNPILRFKEGKKIEKFLNPSRGIGDTYIRKNSNGTVEVLNSNNINPNFNWNRQGTELHNASRLGRYNLLVRAGLRNSYSDMMAPFGMKNLGFKVFKGKDNKGNVVIINRNEDGSMHSGQFTDDEGNTWWIGSDKSVTLIGNKKPQQSTSTSVQKTPISRTRKKSGGNSFRTAFDQARNSGLLEFTWNGNKYNTMKAGETKDQWLLNIGNIATKEAIKFIPPEVNKDTGPVERIPNPIKVTPQSTPDFGYRTNNTYDNMNSFRDNLNQLGINSNESLIGFMNKGRSGLSGWGQLFYNDVDRALGGVYNDDTIRRVFKTQGNWGRGFLGKGDYSDLLGSLGTYAGSWNGAYDRAKELYEVNNPKTSYIPMKKNYKEIFEKIFNALNSNKEEDKSYINRINEQISKNLFKQPFYNIAPIKMPEYNPYPNNPSAIKMPELTLPNNSILPIHMPSYNPYTRSFSFKLGGQLVSKNPILRFKSNFRYVAQ